MSIITKDELRKQILELLQKQEPQKQSEKSLEISAKLFKMREYQEAKKILFYASFGGEVKTESMIKQALKDSKVVGLPKVDQTTKDMTFYQVHNLEKDLKKGSYGIPEPNVDEQNALSKVRADLVIVPGVAFDKNNNRLGRGGGYYDRFLSTLPSEIPSVGLGFDFQLLDCLPNVRAHDISVSYVFNELTT